MWPFRRKNKVSKAGNTGVSCPYCSSFNSMLILNHGTDRPAYIKVWRGQRSLTFRCSDCRRDFYVDEKNIVLDGGAPDDDRPIDDEEALRTAEAELKKQIKEERKKR